MLHAQSKDPTVSMHVTEQPFESKSGGQIQLCALVAHSSVSEA